jgi:EAL domain-containing protein (putative c-di-GMP-specific phosphodiesterase class I)
MNDEAIREVIRNRKIRTVFQPIVNLSDLSIVGFEALSRGPANTELESATALFKAAEGVGLRLQLEQLCRIEALRAARGLAPSCKLFLNASAPSLLDSSLSRAGGSQGIEDPGTDPHQVVLELSERYAVDDYARFREALQSFSRRGFEIALDNMGKGYQGLDKILELVPELIKLIKLDRSMVGNLQESVVKREMIETFQAMSQRFGARIVAQGIETREELRCLRKMNVELGQGYYLARPGEVPVTATILPREL